jgi:CheY-like chemotaxis protein
MDGAWARAVRRHARLTTLDRHPMDSAVPVAWGGLLGLRLATEHPDRTARIVATNTGAAGAVTREHRPDVVVMDIWMPDVDGIDATTQTRPTPTWPWSGCWWSPPSRAVRT